MKSAWEWLQNLKAAFEHGIGIKITPPVFACQRCEGTGQRMGDGCPYCGGSGDAPRGRVGETPQGGTK